MNIKEALADEAPAPTGKCRIQQFLDTVPHDHPDRDDLIYAIQTPWDRRNPDSRTQQQAARILGRLQFSTTYLAVGNHRARPQRCKCAD